MGWCSAVSRMTAYMFTEVSAGYEMPDLLSFLVNLDTGLTATSFSLGFNETQVLLLFCQDEQNYRRGLRDTTSYIPNIKF